MLRKAAILLVGLVAVWLAALALFGWLGAGWQERRTEKRLADKMRARVEIGDLELGLVRGRIGIDDLSIERTDVGVFRLAVDRVDVDLLPLGLALVQDGVGDVRIRGVDVEVTALAALDTRGGKGRPLHFESLVIEDAHVAIEATAILPTLSRVAVRVARASAGDTTLRTPMSWVFALRDLDATIEVPGGHTVRLEYAAGVIRLSGTLVGEPIELPFAIPPLDPARELEQLADLGIALGKELAAKIAERLLQPR